MTVDIDAKVEECERLVGIYGTECVMGNYAEAKEISKQLKTDIASLAQDARAAALAEAAALCRETGSDEQAKQKPVVWVRMQRNEVDWSEDCFSSHPDGLQIDGYDEEDEVYAAPLYTHAQPVKKCVWTHDGRRDGCAMWKPSCCARHWYDGAGDETPAEWNMQWCCFCGGKLVERT